MINLAVPVYSNIKDLFKLADLDSTFSLLMRKALVTISAVNLNQISE